MKKTVDRKRAASGERDEEAGIPLASPQSLLEALRVAQTKQSSPQPEQTPVEPLSDYEVYEPGLGALVRIMDEHPLNWVVGMSEYLQDDYEIVVQYAKNIPGMKSPLAVDTIWSGHLDKEPLVSPGYTTVLEKMHPMVYRGKIKREELTDNSAIIEVGFYSRQKGKTHMRYLGKCKLYFPRPYRGMSYYLDLSKLR